MLEFIVQNAAPIMFVALFLFLLIGYPIAFSLAALGLVFGLIGLEAGVIKPEQMQGIPSRIFGIMSNETLLAIPFFTLMGFIFDRSGLAEELLETIGQIFGSVKGGIAYAVIFVGAILGGPAGVVAATVISMGMISLPVMLRYGYNRELATGVISASGTLAQIIPPSIVLVVVAEQMKVSVGDAYIGALGPSLVLVGLYVLYVFAVTLVRPNYAPALPPEARIQRVPESLARALVVHVPALVGSIATMAAIDYQWISKPTAFFGTLALVAVWVGWYARRERITFKIAATNLVSPIFLWVTLIGLDVTRLGPGELAEGIIRRWPDTGLDVFAWSTVIVLLVSLGLARLQMSLGREQHNRVVHAMMPQVLLIVLTLGTIATGLATPTEGGAMGAFGTLVVAWLRGRLTIDILRQAVIETSKLTSFVIFVLVGATFFSLVFYYFEGHLWVERLLTSLPGGRIGFLIFVNLLVFGLAFFLDVFELAFIVIPLLQPVVEKMGIDPVWFTVMLAVNMQTAFMHPPFGFALMYLRSVAPNKDYKDRVTGALIPAITTGQIYRGAIPFVLVQLVMVGLLIAFPKLVWHEAQSRSEDIPLNFQVEKEPANPSKDGSDETPALNLRFSDDDKAKEPSPTSAEPPKPQK